MLPPPKEEGPSPPLQPLVVAVSLGDLWLVVHHSGFCRAPPTHTPQRPYFQIRSCSRVRGLELQQIFMEDTMQPQTIVKGNFLVV